MKYFHHFLFNLPLLCMSSDNFCLTLMLIRVSGGGVEGCLDTLALLGLGYNRKKPDYHLHSVL